MGQDLDRSVAAPEAFRRRIMATLFAASGLNRTGWIVAITVATLATEDMLGSAAWAGLPGAVGVVGMALGTTPMSLFMERVGRRPGLIGGLLIGATGAAIAGAAIWLNLFALFVIGMFIFGLGNSADRLSRYAAADVTPVARHASAIGLVVWAGTIGSILGPALLGPVERAAERLGIAGLAGPYTLAAVVFVLSAALYSTFLRPDPLSFSQAARSDAATATAVRPLPDLLALPKVRVALAAMIVGQVVMVLIMTMTPIHIRDAGESLGVVGIVISAHTLGMFAFSPATGWLGDRVGRLPVILAGQGLLALSGVMAAFAAGNQRTLLVVSLFLLGLGWNFGFVAGSAYLTEDVPVEARVRLQGIVDTLVWSSGAAASLTSGLLLAAGGYATLSLVGAAMVLLPLVTIARLRPAVVESAAA